MEKLIFILTLVLFYSSCNNKPTDSFSNVNDYKGCVVIGSRISMSCAYTTIIKTIRTTEGIIKSIELPIEYEDIFMEGDTIK